MAIELATAANTIGVTLQRSQTDDGSPLADLSGVIISEDGIYKSSEMPSDKLLPQKTSSPKVTIAQGKKVLSLDVETTGLNPWEYKLVVCSVWDLDEPKGSMQTFAGWDEETLVLELFDYIASKNPDIILAFNAKFEARCFITRAMQFHVQAPWIWSAEWHDMLTILEGGWKNGLTGTMPSGTEENWLEYFFGEVKPFTIDECFEGIRNGSLDEMIIRNRTCVQGQGDMYQLLQYVSATEGTEVLEEKPTFSRVDDWSSGDSHLIECLVCGAINEVKDAEGGGNCWRCLGALPASNQQNIIKESIRPFDYSTVGITAKKATTTTKKAA